MKIDFTKISKKPIIYKWKNLINNKLYFGETKNGYERISSYKNYKRNRYINLAIKKYDLENFELEILHEFDYDNKEERLWIEANYIECFESYKKEFGYNIVRYGEGGLGFHLTEEQKIKISIKNTGKKRSESAKQLIREARKNQDMSHLKTPIKQLDLNGNLIKVWNGLMEIQYTLNIPKSTIYNCINRKNNICAGFKWEYLNKEKGK